MVDTRNERLAGLSTGQSTDKTHVQGTAAFSKFMTVLQAIADDPGKLDIGKLSKLVPYPRGTLYRIVSALVAEDLVSESPSNGTFHLGHRLISFASRSWENSDLRSAARKDIERVRQATGETVHLAVPSGVGMVYIDKLESPRTVRMTSRIGTRVELHSTSVGKAYLAALPDDRCRELIEAIDFRPRTHNTITNPADFYAEIRKVAAQGYSVDNEENEGEIRCFGGAILDRNGLPVGCVSVSIPIHRYDDEVAKTLISELKAAVANISTSVATLL